MRAGLAASGPVAAFEAILHTQLLRLRAQPTDTARAVTDADLSRTACGGGFRAPAFSS